MEYRYSTGKDRLDGCFLAKGVSVFPKLKKRKRKYIPNMINHSRKNGTAITHRGEARFLLLEPVLFIISILYGYIVRWRESLYQKKIFRSKRLPCKVISVGNLTVGGTGKTPMTIHLARLIQNLGYKTAVISRGYKGKAERTGGIVSDGQSILMGPGKAGDEPFMIASKLKNVPVIVGKNRYEAGMLGVKAFEPDVLVLDDAFQHRKLERDLDIVLLDNSLPFGNGHLFPLGTLREPLSALARGDMFILTRSDLEKSPSLSKFEQFGRGKPIFRSSHVPNICTVRMGRNSTRVAEPESIISHDLDLIKDRNVFAFSGLANNQDFHRTIKSLKCNMLGMLEFPDHYCYSDTDLEKIFRLAKDTNVDCLVTTEKDYVRIAHRIIWPIDLVVIGIDVTFEDEEDSFNAVIRSRLKSIQ
ncbi:tetraacyldisaccharide 4'-kinase [Thermodesulfobacteriota bacterium]